MSCLALSKENTEGDFRTFKTRNFDPKYSFKINYIQ